MAMFQTGIVLDVFSSCRKAVNTVCFELFFPNMSGEVIVEGFNGLHPYLFSIFS
jgi:hypothetical protein